MKILQLLILLIPISLFTSCNNEDEVTPGKYDNGVLVVNEGNFLDADGSVSFYNSETAEADQKIFEQENGIPFSGLLQSIYVEGELTFLVDNIGNRIEVVNSSDLKSISIINEGLNSPRYITVSGSKIYVSNWGPFDENFALNESFVAVYNLNGFELLKTIPVPSGPEELISNGGNVFVSSLFTSTISIIGTSSDQINGNIEAEIGSSGMELENESRFWASCTSGRIISINTIENTIESNIPIDGLSGKLSIDINNGYLYALTSEFAPDFSFTDNAVVKVALNTPSENETIYQGKNLYGIGVEPSGNGDIYIANSNAFQGNGTGIIIDNSGTLIESFSTGRGPNGFVFK